MKSVEDDDTIPVMDYIQVDVLTSGQLEVDDLIEVDGEIVNIVSITSLSDGYILEVVDDFGEHSDIQVEEYQQHKLFMLM